MWKKVIGVFIGFLASFLVIMIIESINHVIFPDLPQPTDFEDPEAFADAFSQIPAMALVIVIIAHAAGSFSAGLVCALFAPDNRVRLAVVTGFLVLFMGILNLVWVPHPTWFMVADLMVYVPMAYLGGLVVAKRGE